MRSGRRQRITELCNTLLECGEIDQMSPQTCPLMSELVRLGFIRYRPLLFRCVDHGLEDVGLHMVTTLKADYHIADFQVSASCNFMQMLSTLKNENLRTTASLCKLVVFSACTASSK
jgi:hypothetical protein